LNVNDGFGLLELARQAGVLGPQAAVLFRQRIDGEFSASLLGGEPLESALLALAPPGRQMGAVQALPRRNGAPMAPFSRQASAWSRIERLYSAVNRRRRAVAGTSRSEMGAGAVVGEAAPVRTPSAPSSPFTLRPSP